MQSGFICDDAYIDTPRHKVLTNMYSKMVMIVSADKLPISFLKVSPIVLVS